MLTAKTAFDKEIWDLNPSEFNSRFNPEMTNNHGPLRLRNLYFTYLVELRALAKAAPYLKDVSLFLDFIKFICLFFCIFYFLF